MKLIFILIGIILHLILLFAPLNIYFTSPITDIARKHEISREGLAKRIVLVSTGGLRANTFYDNIESLPFLNKLISDGKALFAIAETKLPSDSKPSHFAILSGVHESPNILSQYLNINPKIDTIFDRSQAAYLFGNSPLLTTLLSNDTDKQHHLLYQPFKTTLSNTNASIQSTFNQITSLLSSDFVNKNTSKLTIFAYLDGTDVIGHAVKPTSSRYLQNIQVIDNHLQDLFNLLEKEFPDHSTTYILTSDHGITDWGTHGSGSDHEIYVPFVAFGAGVQGYRRKQSLRQIDIAPFLAALLGTAVPKNNFGTLPLKFLKATSVYKYQASCGNLKQMMEQFIVKRQLRYNQTFPFLFKEHNDFTTETLKALSKELVKLHDVRRYDTATSMCQEMIPKMARAISFFHKYDRTPMSCCIVFTFLLWIIFVHESTSHFKPKPAFLIFVAINFLMDLYLQKSWKYQLYHITPIYFLSIFHNIFDIRSYFISSFAKLQAIPISLLKTYLIQIYSTIIHRLLPLIIFILTFFELRLISIILVSLGFLPFYHQNKLYPWLYIWVGTCFLLSLYTFLPPVNASSRPELVFSSFLVSALTIAFHIAKATETQVPLKKTFPISILVIGTINLINSLYPTYFLTIILFLATQTYLFIIPLASSLHLSHKLILTLGSFFVTYSLLSTNTESCFFLLFCVLLFCYVRLEHSVYYEYEFNQIQLVSIPSPNDSFYAEWQRSIIFISLLLLIFASTGRVDLSNTCGTTTYLPTSFNLFFPLKLNYILLLMKQFIPYFALTIAFASCLFRRNADIYRLSLLIMIISNAIGMVMFMNLKDEGSVVEAGISLSNYVIAMTISLLSLIFLNVSHNFLMLDLNYLRKYVLGIEESDKSKDCV
uniref:GPI ethanolamine phosphate transferase 1 n=1 Tax=Rhabditophanes sp. KR3021 TaxID=114890 RepID=A0AC35TLT4_9BILA